MSHTHSPTLAAAPRNTEAAPRNPMAWLASDAFIQGMVIAALLAGWEIAARAGVVQPFLLPALSTVLQRIWEDVVSGTALLDLGLTLYRAASGFAIAVALAIPLGVLMARSKAVNWFFDPLISIGFPMPKIAFLPIFILWFGIFDASKIVMIAFSCFFPIVAAAYAGTLGVEKWLIWSARSFGATPNQILRQVILPMALPQILTGIQIAVPVGLITTVATEMLMGGAGVGGTMMQSGRFADSPGVFAGIVEIALLGTVVVRSMEWVRGRLLSWHPESRH